MGRAKLPEARIAPRGVEGHLAKLRAEAREGTRVAGAIGVRVARILGWTAFAGGTVAVLAWLAPPPHSPQLDELRRIQTDVQRQQQVWQSQESFRLSQDLLRAQAMPVPTFPSDLGIYRPSPTTYDWSSPLPPPVTVMAPAAATTTANAGAAKEAHAAQRAQAIEAKRAQRGH